MRNLTPIAIPGIIILYLGLATANVLTLRPWCDEGWFSNPAHNLYTTGHMETSVLDPTASWRLVNMQGIDRHTYWVLPLYIVTQAAWDRIAGFGVVHIRMLSVLWGLIALLSWYGILQRLSGSTAVILLALLLMATDFQFLISAANARMDMMTFALESAALAIYLNLRERHLTFAVIISQTLAAAGVFTHPLGCLGAGGLVFVSFYLDRKRLRPVHYMLAPLPYLAAGAGWGLYIMESPSDFLVQFTSNSSGRLDWLTAPFATLWREINLRYLETYGLAAGLPITSRVKSVVLAIYIAGVATAYALRSVRSDRLLRILLILFAWHVVGLTLVDSFGIGWYLIHIVPLALVLVAISAVHLWNLRRVPRALILAPLLLLVAVQLMVTMWRVREDRRADFLQAAAFLRSHLSSYHLIMASAEFGIPFDFDRRFLDDFRLGYRSGKIPDLVVMGKPRYRVWSELLRDQDPPNYRYIHRLLDRYQIVYNHGAYCMYERPGIGAMKASEKRP